MDKEHEQIELRKINDHLYEIPKTGKMRVPVLVYANEELLKIMKKDKTLIQGRNMAHLPGIKKAFIMPDGHQGYGFPIGGVAAIDVNEGGISPGGIGYDINCGVRLLVSNLSRKDVEHKLKELIDELYNHIPAGLGEGNVKVTNEELDKILNTGARWAVENSYGTKDDLLNCEESGELKMADSKKVSQKAKSRGRGQIGSLGSGNHFIEVQYVGEVFNSDVAEVFGLKKDQVVLMIHCGSRGLGHQVCSDYLRDMEKQFSQDIEKLPDRELAYAPAGTKLCDDYFSAMCAAANFAWCNRHVIGHFARVAFKKVFPNSELKTMYDVAHNIAKVEEHIIDGKKIKVYMHRKGATRAFGPKRPEIPKHYQKTGQPTIIPGSMGTASYVLVGTDQGMDETLGSTAHGAGRLMSRHQAINDFNGDAITKELKDKQGIIVKGHSMKGIAEEAPNAYKDIDQVANVSNDAHIGNMVVRLKPMGVVKG